MLPSAIWVRCGWYFRSDGDLALGRMQKTLLGEIGEGNSGQPLHLAHTGGAGDIDLTEMAIDHVDTHEEQSLLA